MSQEQDNNETQAEANGSVTIMTKKLDDVLTMQVSVLNTFFTKYPDLTVEKIVSDNMDLKDLLKPPYEMGKSLHNAKEAALQIFENKNKLLHKEFWINGKRLSEEEAAKLEHDTNFGNKLQDMMAKD